MLKHMKMVIRQHPLIDVLYRLKGNPRIAIVTQPLFSIPNYLFSPFVSLFLYGSGLTDLQIGTLSTLSTILLMLSSVFVGAALDKYGRRPVTYFGDMAGWVLPLIIWVFARNYVWFVVAAICCGLRMGTDVGFKLLLTEDAEPDTLPGLFNWITICGLFSVFFAPLAGLLVNHLTVVPAVRVLYALAAVCFAAKASWLFFGGKETARGLERIKANRHQSIWHLVKEYGTVFKLVFRSPSVWAVMIITAAVNVTNTTTNNFMSLYVVENLGFPQAYVSYFPMIRSAMMLIFMFAIQSLLDRATFRVSMGLGLIVYLGSQLLLIFSPPHNAFVIFLYIALEASGYAMVFPRKDAISMLFVNQKERARIQTVIATVMLAISTPFGWISGVLSTANRTLPFWMNTLIFAGALLLVLICHYFNRRPEDGVVPEAQHDENL